MGILLEFLQSGKVTLKVDLKDILSVSLQLGITLLDLERYSLITWYHDSKTVCIHPLVQMTVRDQLPENELSAWMTVVIGLYNSTFP